MKTLIVCEALDLKGSSEGIVSNSFIRKYLKLFPDKKVDIIWIDTRNKGVNPKVEDYDFKFKYIHIGFKVHRIVTKLNAGVNRVFNKNTINNFKIKKIKKVISEIDFDSYNNIYFRSAGIEYFLFQALEDNKYLNKISLNFHDPYPASLYPGTNTKFSKQDFNSIMIFRKIVKNAKFVFSPSHYLSSDLGFLYSRVFEVIPHQFDESIFNSMPVDQINELDCNFYYITYHGAIQHNRNLDLVLEAFCEICSKNEMVSRKVKFVIRSNGGEVKFLKEKYITNKNILFLNTVDARESYLEQKKYSSLSVILETNGEYSNILGGKVPMLASIDTRILCISSSISEMRNVLKDSPDDIVFYDLADIRIKLEKKLFEIINNEKLKPSLKKYFSNDVFKEKIQFAEVNSDIK